MLSSPLCENFLVLRYVLLHNTLPHESRGIYLPCLSEECVQNTVCSKCSKIKHRIEIADRGYISSKFLYIDEITSTKQSLIFFSSLF